MKYEVKNVKGFMGMDCPGFNATLYRDGVKVAFLIDDGNGGEVSFDWVDRSGPRVEVPWVNHQNEAIVIRGCTVEEGKLYDFLRGKTWNMGPELGGKDIQTDPGYFVSELVGEFEDAKRFNRLCKTKVLFRLKTDKKGEWRTFKGAFTKQIKDWIVSKYGDQVESIMNETVGQVAA